MEEGRRALKILTGKPICICFDGLVITAQMHCDLFLSIVIPRIYISLGCEYAD